MYRYVVTQLRQLSLRVRDTIDARKFACQQNLSTRQQNHQQNDKPETSELIKSQEIQFLQSKTYEEFKKRYNCKHPHNCNNLLQAITWSTALIAGFYASQLICLYRRNHHRIDAKKCFYTKYLCFKNQQFHRKFLFAQYELKKKHFSCRRDVSKYAKTEEISRTRKVSQFAERPEDFKFSGLEFFTKRFEKFYDTSKDEDVIQRKVFHVDNNKTKVNVVKVEETEDEKVQRVFENLTNMIGELEVQMGIECIKQGLFEEAAEHLKMAINSNNNSACYNLALLYEHGLGVEKDMVMAKRLYQLAAELGNRGAMYNLGVFFANGLGGTKKSFRQARICFEKAAELGDEDATAALEMLYPSKRKMSSEPEDFIGTDHESDSFERRPVAIKSY